MNAFATRLAIDSAPRNRTTDPPSAPDERPPSRWARIRRAAQGRATDARATPK